MHQKGHPLARFAVGVIVLWVLGVLFTRWMPVRKVQAVDVQFGAASYGPAFDELKKVHESVVATYEIKGDGTWPRGHSYFVGMSPEDRTGISSAVGNGRKVYVSFISERAVKDGTGYFFEPMAQGPFLLTREGLIRVGNIDKSSRNSPRYGFTGTLPEDLPQDGELLDAGAEFFQKVPARAGATWPSGRWEITGVPVLASSDCLECHRGMDGSPRKRVGDTVGVAMYAYRQGTF